MKSKYPFKCILRYIPDRYDNLQDWQKANRRVIYDFKRGKISAEHQERILDAVKSIIRDNAHEWVICFVPAHTQEETEARFASLAAFLKERLSCPVCLHSVRNYKDYLPVHQSGVMKEVKLHFLQKEDIIGKRVVLIDDIITTGRSFREIGDKLIWSGALSVYGVCFAKTIHPNLPLKAKKQYKRQSPMNTS